MMRWLSLRVPLLSRPGRRPGLDSSSLTTASVRRKASRALLANVVVEGMLRTGVLSHQFKFKMLALDKAHESFHVLIEVAPEADDVDEGCQGQCELWVRHTAAFLHQIQVVSIYWRRVRMLDARDRPAFEVPAQDGLSHTHYAGL